MKFDPPFLIETLDGLPKRLRAAFAALCAERLAPAYTSFAERNGLNPEELSLMLERLWRDLEGDELSLEQLRAYAQASEALIPDGDADWVGSPAYGDDAAAALAYAFRARLAGDSREAVSAAQRVHDALDHFVIAQEGIDLNASGAEQRVLSHPSIQQEFARQRHDLDQLGKLPNDPSGSVVLSRLRQEAKDGTHRFLIG
jgi:uncharacterized protein YjaG (DUF416 family)